MLGLRAFGLRTLVSAAAPKLKLTYFNIEGAGEKVRLALKIGGIKFQDDRIEMARWPEIKRQAPFGQLPLLTIDDGPYITQSGAMLRYVGRLTGMYPADPAKALKVDEVVGLQEDLSRALFPSFVVGRNPPALGYPANLSDEEKKAIQAKLRAELVKEKGDVPRFLGFFEEILKSNGTRLPQS